MDSTGLGSCDVNPSETSSAFSLEWLLVNWKKNDTISTVNSNFPKN